MKKNLTSLIFSLSLCATLVFPVGLSEQNSQAHNKPKQHHFKLIDLGTFGGPQGYLNDAGGLVAVAVLNNQGALAGWADTSSPDPHAPNFCFDLDCFVAHAFKWKNGVRSDLGVLPGGANSQPNWISESGLIAGVADNGEIDPLITGFPELRAVLWKDGEIKDIGTLAEGGYESFANSVNTGGQVIGLALNTIPDLNSMTGLGFQTRAFSWENGVMQDLGTLGTGTDAQAILVNERGQVVGWSYTSSAQSGVCASFGLPLSTGSFLWDKEHGMVDLGGFGGTCTTASGLNNRGQVVGESFLTGDQASHAFLWERATGIKDLGTLGGDFASAYAINDDGEAVGGSYLQGDVQLDAALWGKDGNTDLGALEGDTCAFAFSINAQRQVVGNSNCFFESTRGFLWEDGGPMLDLNTLVSPSSGLYVTVGLTINDRGEIAGEGVDVNGNQHALLLIPCDENHPGMEDCDYSPVDTAATEIGTRSDSVRRDASVAGPSLETNGPSPEIQRSLGGANSPINQMFRRRFGFARSLRTPQASALTTTSTTAGLRITSGPPPSGTVGRAYDFRCAQIPPCNVFEAGYSLTAAGGVPPYSMHWAGAPGSSVPPGLGLFAAPHFLCINVKLPAICGKPTVAGTHHVIVTVADRSSPPLHASASYSITIFQ